MLKEYLDLTATDTAETMFKITRERLNEMNDYMLLLEAEVAENHKDYTVPGTDESPGDGLHVGKVLERLLEFAKTTKEELALLYAFGNFLSRVLDKVQQTILKERLIQKYKSANIFKS